jgi:hypothetical protein
MHRGRLASRRHGVADRKHRANSGPQSRRMSRLDAPPTPTNASARISSGGVTLQNVGLTTTARNFFRITLQPASRGGVNWFSRRSDGVNRACAPLLAIGPEGEDAGHRTPAQCGPWC